MPFDAFLWETRGELSHPWELTLHQLTVQADAKKIGFGKFTVRQRFLPKGSKG